MLQVIYFTWLKLVPYCADVSLWLPDLSWFLTWMYFTVSSKHNNSWCTFSYNSEAGKIIRAYMILTLQSSLEFTHNNLQLLRFKEVKETEIKFCSPQYYLALSLRILLKWDTSFFDQHITMLNGMTDWWWILMDTDDGYLHVTFDRLPSPKII